ncbi:MAG: hypothetical protein NVSMB51_06380 [Solirubrobacteraceae bacterium]
MRVRTIALGLAAAALGLAPGGAAAASGHHHAKQHAAGKHKHGKAKAQRTVHIGHMPLSLLPPPLPSNTTPPGTPPTTTPDTPPTAPTAAASVVSFSGGVLTLRLNNGTQLSGTVTGETELSCVSSTPPNADDDAAETDAEDGAAPPVAGTAPVFSHASPSGESVHPSSGDDEGEQETSCSSSVLVTGASIQAAELRISPAGATFHRLVVIQ